MEITFMEIAAGVYFTNKQGKLYIKVDDPYKKSIPSYRKTCTNPNLVVTPLYDVPVVVGGGDLRTVHYKNKNGEYHRVDGPAIEYAYGSEEWYYNGCRHRANGPAVQTTDGFEAWYWHGTIHREGGPAKIHRDGHKEWHQRGLLHRTDGPAVEYTDGSKEWWFNGTEYDQLTHWLIVNQPVVRRNEWYLRGTARD